MNDDSTTGLKSYDDAIALLASRRFLGGAYATVNVDLTMVETDTRTAFVATLFDVDMETVTDDVMRALEERKAVLEIFRWQPVFTEEEMEDL